MIHSPSDKRSFPSKEYHNVVGFWLKDSMFDRKGEFSYNLKHKTLYQRVYHRGYSRYLVTFRKPKEGTFKLDGSNSREIRGEGNPCEVGDTRTDAATLSLWGRSLTSCISSKQ